MFIFRNDLFTDLTYKICTLYIIMFFQTLIKLKVSQTVEVESFFSEERILKLPQGSNERLLCEHFCCQDFGELFNVQLFLTNDDGSLEK